MTASKIAELDPIISISPEDVFLVENVSETLSNSITYANLVSFMATSLSTEIAVPSLTVWQSNSTVIVNSGFANFIGAGVSVADVGGVATIDIAGGSYIAVSDEGVELDAAVTGLNFVGAGVSATSSSNTTTVTINGAAVTTIDFTATAEQTVLTVNYSTASVNVFVSGVKLRDDSYIATSGTSITLDEPLDLDTWVSVETLL
jgi:hypothetical protein